MLQGDTDTKSPRELTPEAKKALRVVEKAISGQQLFRVNYTQPWSLIIIATAFTPTGCLWQEAPLEWIHLPASPKKIITSYPSMVASQISKGRHRSQELFGKDVSTIVIPYSSEQLIILLQTSADWQISVEGFSGQFSYHLPKSPLLQFASKHNFLFPYRVSSEPIFNAPLVFTDGSSNGIAATIIDGKAYVQQAQESSAQITEIMAVIFAFQQLSQSTFNLYTDSLNVLSGCFLILKLL